MTPLCCLLQAAVDVCRVDKSISLELRCEALKRGESMPPSGSRYALDIFWPGDALGSMVEGAVGFEYARVLDPRDEDILISDLPKYISLRVRGHDPKFSLNVDAWGSVPSVPDAVHGGVYLIRDEANDTSVLETEEVVLGPLGIPTRAVLLRRANGRSGAVFHQWADRQEIASISQGLRAPLPADRWSVRECWASELRYREARQG